MNIDTVVFDFDGTIADTNSLVINSFKYIYNIYKKEINIDYIRTTFGEPLRNVMLRDFPDNDVDEVLSIYREYQGKRFDDEVKLYKSVKDTLNELEKRNIKMGIATSRLRNTTFRGLNNLEIINFFDSIVTADDVENHKPHQEPLLKTIKELKSHPSNTLYIGDSHHDMECAINAKATPILVGWHPNSKEICTKYKINYVLDNMMDLISLI